MLQRQTWKHLDYRRLPYLNGVERMDVERIAFTPILINVSDGKKAVIVESDL